MYLASYTSKKESPPCLWKYRSSTAFIIATVWMSMFTDFVLYAMIVPVMPTALVARAGIPYEDREFWVSVLLMCEAGVALLSCPIFGYMVDVSGSRQLPFLLGLMLLAASMAMLAFAHTISLFVIARLLQGSATAMVAVAGLALMTDSVDLDNLGRSIGYLGSATALGFLLGPFLGGLVYDSLGYNAVFGMAFAIISVDMVLRVMVIEKKFAKRWIKPTTEESSPRSEPDYHTLPRENGQRTPNSAEGEPSAGIAIFQIAKQPRILITSWALLVDGLIYAAFDSTLPVFVESRYGWSPFGAGLVFLPSAIASFFEPFFGHLSDKYGARTITFTGFFLLCPTLVCLRFVEHNSLPFIITLIMLLVLVGVFMNLGLPALFVETQTVLDDMEHKQPGMFGDSRAIAQAFSLQTMAQFTGLFLGPLWGGFIEYHFGWKTMAWTLGLLAGLTAVPMLWLSGSPASLASFSSGKLEGGNVEDEEVEPLLRNTSGNRSGQWDDGRV